MLLSTTILVKELDDRLAKLIDQCREFSDEIVLVTNKDSKIAIPHTRTVEFNWCNDFSKARNFAFEQCKGEYIVWFDADDGISGGDKIRAKVEDMKARNIDWLAIPYMYAESVGLKQYKERIFKKGTVKWEKSVHENPVETRTTTKDLVEDISVIHFKTPEEAKQAQERNLTYLLEEYNRDKQNADPRTVMYLGRTLSGIGERYILSKDDRGYEVLEKANHFFMEYIPKSGWDEDKYFAILMLAKNLGILGEVEEGISYALGAMRIYPAWNKAYFTLGDLYLKTDPSKAIEFIKIGLSKETPQTMLAVSKFEETIAARAQLAEAYLLTGKIDEAYALCEYFKNSNNKSVDKLVDVIKDAKETEDYVKGVATALQYISKTNKDSAIKILDALPANLSDDIRLHAIRNEIATPKTWGKKEIAIVCQFAYETWADPSAVSGIGGSEEAVIYLSRELTKAGYKVTVYNKCRELRGTYNGVDYRNEYELNVKDRFSTIIAWRNPEFFVRNRIIATNKWVWMHDVPQVKITKEIYSSFDKIIVLSDYHRSLIQDVPDDKVMISSNGIVPEHFENLPEKELNTIFYGSSPDRGLECLLKDIMPLVKKEIPDAKLHFCYGWVTFDKMYEGNEKAMAWKQKILDMAKKVGAEDHGRLGHRQLAKLMGRCVVHAYPTEFTEINNITIQKTQSAGCVPVSTDVGATKEFNRQGCIIEGSKIYTSSVLQSKFAKTVIEQLKNPKKIDTKKAIKEFKWENVSNQWITEIESSAVKTVTK